MEKRKSNCSLWAGFLIAVIAFVSYFLFFSQFPITRDFPWVNFLLFGLAAVLLAVGLRRAFARSSSYRGKISGLILAIFSAAVLGAFCFTVFIESRHLPSAAGAPKVGQEGPGFSLYDMNGKSLSLAELLSAPLVDQSGPGRAPKGVLLVFYRGYWWPFCNSELRGIEQNLDALEALGIRPVAISVDAPEVSKGLCSRHGYTYTFLSDPDAGVIRSYGVLHPGAGIKGHDIARPAEFLLDSSGTVRWVNLTEDLRVRARPEQMIEAAKALH
jgi:peroxiredoxin